MRRLLSLALLALLAPSLALAQIGARRIDGSDGIAGVVHTPATDTTTAGTIVARNLTATALTTPGSITVTPVLSKVGSITTVAGSALVDGDSFVIKYGPGLTVPVEFDLAPGNGTTGGAVPYVYTALDTADQIRDGLITLLNAAAGTALTASSGGAATVSLVLDTPGAAGDTNTEAVANAGFAVTGFVDPTHATTVTYYLVGVAPDGSLVGGGPASTTTLATATLSASNYLSLSWSAVTGYASYRVYRTVAPTSPATTGIVYAGTGLSVSDTGLAGGGEVAPTVNGTGVVTGRGVLSTGTTVTPGTGTATARVGGVLYVSTTAQATTGTSEEVLATYAMPANTLARDGQIIRITAIGAHAANTNAATFRVRFGGISGKIVATIASSTNGSFYRLVGEVLRTGAATLIIGGTATAASATDTSGNAGTADLTGAVNIVVTGVTAVAAGDLTFRSLLVEALN